MISPYHANDVTVIVVTYNSAHCIDGLANTLAVLPHVILVDNASNDDTVKKAALAMPNAKIICNARNLGFGAANNRGLQQTTTCFALLLNPDCLLTADVVPQLLEVAAAYPDAAIIAPHLIRRDGGIEVSYRWPNTHWRSRGPAAEGPVCVGFVCGAAMLLNMAIMRDVGFFDEDFFLYYEDEDLCQRAFISRRQIILAPHVKVTHLSRGSVRGKSRVRAEFFRGYHHVQSKLIFAAKHVSGVHASKLRWKTLLLAVAAVPLRMLVPVPRYVARLFGRIAGLWAFDAKYFKH